MSGTLHFKEIFQMIVSFIQTTLRIDDQLYREAKAEAVRAGLSLTRILKEGLRLRLEKMPLQSGATHGLRTYAAAPPDARSWEELRRIAGAEQEAHDFAKLGIPHRKALWPHSPPMQPS